MASTGTITVEALNRILSIGPVLALSDLWIVLKFDGVFPKYWFRWLRTPM